MMIQLNLMMLTLAVLQYATADSITDGTELVFTYAVNRHGDRAPVKQVLGYVTKSLDMDVVEKKVAKYGYEQLTNEGKQRAYELGKFLRSRYDGFIAKTYNPSELLMHSDDTTRTKETLKMEIAGLYPSQSKISNNTVIYGPVPDSVINNTYDVLEFSPNCSVFSKYFLNSIISSHPSISTQYPVLLAEVRKITGLNITSHPALMYVIYDAYLSLQNVGYKLNPNIEALLPDLKKAAGDAIDVLLGQHEFLPLEAGVLLNDFFTVANKISNGAATEKMYLNSAHDLNVYAMQMISGVAPSHRYPFYCSLFALELRRVIQTGELVVLPVYLPKPGDQVEYLRVRGCGGLLCGYETFKGITRGSNITIAEYHSQCQANSTSSR